MKKSILTIAILISGLFVASLVFTSCGSKTEQATEEHDHMDTDTTHQHDEMDATQVAYACPMHPEVTGKEGDMCSQCGMKLEPVKDADTTDSGNN